MHKFDCECKPFTFDNLVSSFRSVMKKFPDKRIGNNSQYAIEDAAAGAFSIFFTQSPSFLAFQDSMQKTKGKSNVDIMNILGITTS